MRATLAFPLKNYNKFLFGTSCRYSYFWIFKKKRSVNNALVIVHLFMIFLCIVLYFAPLKDQARRRRTQACSQGKLPAHRLSWVCIILDYWLLQSDKVSFLSHSLEAKGEEMVGKPVWEQFHLPEENTIRGGGSTALYTIYSAQCAVCTVCFPSNRTSWDIS